MPVLKGGHEILDLVPGPREHVELEIKCFLSPNYVIPGPPGSPTTGTGGTAPLWCTSAVPLQKIPVAIEGSRLKIWECYKVKTGIFNIGTWIPVTVAQAFNGPTGSAWAVSGMPMSMLPVVTSTNSNASDATKVPPITNQTQPAALNEHWTYSVGQYQFNPWVENAKYFQRISMGQVPFQFGDNNSTTVLLTDENGWGIMCPNQEVFLTACDFATQGNPTDPPVSTEAYTCFQFPRYFTLYFRQRYVKSPVVLADIFQDYALKQVAGYIGEYENIMEVSMITGRQENAPIGMLNSSGVRNGPENTTTSTSATEETTLKKNVLEVPPLFKQPTQSTTTAGKPSQAEQHSSSPSGPSLLRAPLR